LSFWIELAQTLERGKFDSLFVADALGVLDVYRGNPEQTLREGLQTPTDDPLLVVSAMAAATKHLGFGITVASLYRARRSSRRPVSAAVRTSGGLGT
jgi:alkanesulfonate monooxygenase SsuD/methylene tetrahydromethanopterin reductase-like flavin-dependent oxidoreductase (luciferase family)